MADESITASRLRDVFDYSPDTGQFVRKLKTSSNAIMGKPSGWSGADGRVVIEADGKRYRAHRLAWLYVYGCWPSKKIDHINGDPSDNRISNLRDVSQSTNMENQRKARSDNKSGFLGVCFCKHHQKWKASIRVKGRLQHVAYKDTAEEAYAAYLDAKRASHQGCTI